MRERRPEYCSIILLNSGGFAECLPSLAWNAGPSFRLIISDRRFGMWPFVANKTCSVTPR